MRRSIGWGAIALTALFGGCGPSTQGTGVTRAEYELIERWVTCGDCAAQPGDPGAVSAEALRDSVEALGPRAVPVLADLADGISQDQRNELSTRFTPREVDNFDALVRKRAARSLRDLGAVPELQTALAAANAFGRPDVIAAIEAELDVAMGVAPSYTVRVDPPRVGIQLGEAFQLQAFVEDSRGNLTTPPVTWTSSDPALATVSDGLVTGAGVGTATVSATAQGITAEATVTVLAGERHVIDRGGDQQAGLPTQALPDPISITLADESGAVLPGVSVLWTVLEGGGSLVGDAATDATGRAQAEWTLGPTRGLNRASAEVLGARTALFYAIAGVDPTLPAQPGQTQQAVSLPTAGVILGTVTVDGAGLGGAQVTIQGTAQAAITDAGGNFLFSGVQAGSYVVDVDLPPDVEGFTASVTSTVDGPSVTFAGAAFRSAAIGGFVVSPGGRPARGVTVTVSGPDGGTTATGAGGEFLFLVRPGTYTVGIADFGPLRFPATATQATVTAGETEIVLFFGN